LANRDSEVVQKSIEVLKELGEFAVPFLVSTLNRTNDRELCSRVIDILETIGTRAWQEALPRLYHKIRDSPDPVISDRLIQALRSLPPYRPPAAAAESPMKQAEQPPDCGGLPEETNASPIGAESSEMGRPHATASRSRHRAKATRKSRASTDDPLIGRRVPRSKSQLDC
jgi:hypothetical protein